MKIETVCGVFTVEYTYFKPQIILIEAKYVVEHKSGEGGHLFEHYFSDWLTDIQHWDLKVRLCRTVTHIFSIL